MPTVVSSKILGIYPQADGDSYYEFKLVDDAGVETVLTNLLPKGADPEKVLAQHVVAAESYVAPPPPDPFAVITDKQIVDEVVKRDLKDEVAALGAIGHG